MVITTQLYISPVGELLMGSIDGELCLCDWRYRNKREAIDKRIQTALKSTYQEGESDVLAQTRKALDEYFSGQRKQFNLPLKLVGTEFQQRVWQVLRGVEYAETCSYQALAYRMNNPAAVRAVANANGANALSIIVPCHRIVGSNGELTGYAGGLKAKQKLLALEQQGSLGLL